MDNARIVLIESATLLGRRPREAGCNARLQVHGNDVRVSLVRLTTDDGISGFGFCNADAEQAHMLMGAELSTLLTPTGGVADQVSIFEFPLWDLLGQQMNQPVYQIAAGDGDKLGRDPLRVPCYDTSLYIDDLHLNSDEEAADLIADEARYGYEHKHRAFKIKVGRGARHMPLEDGTVRDIAVIRAVREAVGPDATIMIDANNGYNLNIAKRVLESTADCNLFWLEEAFHEDRVLYEALSEWMDKEGLSVLIADGEGQASPSLMDWAREGVVDVIQYDIFSHGFGNWLRTGAQLDAWGVCTAPHHYGRHLGNYVSGHLAAAVSNFAFVEWDEVTTPGLDTSAYRVEEGQVVIPNSPGFGLALEDSVFRAAVADGGFELKL